MVPPSMSRAPPFPHVHAGDGALVPALTGRRSVKLSVVAGLANRIGILFMLCPTPMTSKRDDDSIRGRSKPVSEVSQRSHGGVHLPGRLPEEPDRADRSAALQTIESSHVMSQA